MRKEKKIFRSLFSVSLNNIDLPLRVFLFFFFLTLGLFYEHSFKFLKDAYSWISWVICSFFKASHSFLFPTFRIPHFPIVIPVLLIAPRLPNLWVLGSLLSFAGNFINLMDLHIMMPRVWYMYVCVSLCVYVCFYSRPLQVSAAKRKPSGGEPVTMNPSPKIVAIWFFPSFSFL